MTGKKILYVEDDKDIASTVRTILEKEGYVVELAYSGKSAIRMAQKGFDLFLLDVMLPDMSGWDTFEKIKKPGRKFVFLSAISVSKERIAELKKAGISDYITKPFAVEDLVKRVKKILKV